MTEMFVGAWRLVSWVMTDSSGEISHPYGTSPHGQIIYTSNGQMSAQLMRPGAVIPDSSESTPRAILAAVSSVFFAYYGTYSVNEAARTVIHHIEGSIAPSWIGTEQVRGYRFIDGDRLELTASLAGDAVAENAGAGGSNVLVWERIP